MTPVLSTFRSSARVALVASIVFFAGGCASLSSAPRPAAIESKPRRPFPQHVGFPGCADCIRPAVAQDALDEDVVDFYEDWKKLFTRIASGDVAGEFVV